MSTQNSNSAEALPQSLRAAFETYRNDASASSWTALSQLSVRDDMDVLDALQAADPRFPDPLPLPVDGLVEDNNDFFQWPQLPDPDGVLRAILAALQR
jgi:hypothetical protein